MTLKQLTTPELERQHAICVVRARHLKSKKRAEFKTEAVDNNDHFTAITRELKRRQDHG